MSFVDRLSLDKAIIVPQSLNELAEQWCRLEPEEVALLVVSDVDYLLQTINQGEKHPTLV